jgi:hypothetical protein
MEIVFLIGLYLLIISILAWQILIEKKRKKQQEQFEKIFYKKIDNYQKYQEEEKNMILFKPYLARIIQETIAYNEEGEELHRLPKNSFCTVIYEKNDQCKLLMGGWINKDNAQKNFARIKTQIPARVKEKTFLKNGPSQGYETITHIERGQIVEIEDVFGNWCKVKCEKGEGYMLKTLIEEC